MIPELTDRYRDVFRHIVANYLEHGEPVGSRTLARQMGLSLSPATIRNVMADLEEAGLLCAPHTSAGRLPTSQGLRLYIDGLMEMGRLSEDECKAIDAQCLSSGQTSAQVLERAGDVLSGLSQWMGLVIAPKREQALRSIHFVRINPAQILVVLVGQDGGVENRLMQATPDMQDSSLEKATNLLNAMIAKGHNTFPSLHQVIRHAADDHRAQLDSLTLNLINAGLADPSSFGADHIVIRGQSRILQDVKALEELERARSLFAALEEQNTMTRLLEAVGHGDGVQIFIGAQNRAFEQEGWSLIISPYRAKDHSIVGAIGVIGPTRLNYGRIIPLVDYTSQVIGRLLSEPVLQDTGR